VPFAFFGFHSVIRSTSSFMIATVMANKPDAVNPAIALGLTIRHQWRRVTDLER
jgi:hypothetical protein